jgi:hypothetical protein
VLLGNALDLCSLLAVVNLPPNFPEYINSLCELQNAEETTGMQNKRWKYQMRTMMQGEVGASLFKPTYVYYL